MDLPDVLTTKVKPTPEHLRRRARRIRLTKLISCFVLVALFYVFYVGDNRWRVQYHHGVQVPSSATDFKCSGATAITCWLGDHSHAEFTIVPTALPGFLSQFQEAVKVPAGGTGFRIVGKAWSQAATPSGEAWGPSPTGTDLYVLKWRTTQIRVRIELDTSWN
jgi:hypothetical protein